MPPPRKQKLIIPAVEAASGQSEGSCAEAPGLRNEAGMSFIFSRLTLPVIALFPIQEGSSQWKVAGKKLVFSNFCFRGLALNFQLSTFDFRLVNFHNSQIPQPEARWFRKMRNQKCCSLHFVPSLSRHFRRSTFDFGERSCRLGRWR